MLCRFRSRVLISREKRNVTRGSTDGPDAALGAFAGEGGGCAPAGGRTAAAPLLRSASVASEPKEPTGASSGGVAVCALTGSGSRSSSPLK
jgi:hypothetical protein